MPQGVAQNVSPPFKAIAGKSRTRLRRIFVRLRGATAGA
jgi:hypothetical protein